MSILRGVPYPVAILGTVITVVLAWVVDAVGSRIINRVSGDRRGRYGQRQVLSTIVVIGQLR